MNAPAQPRLIRLSEREFRLSLPSEERVIYYRAEVLPEVAATNPSPSRRTGEIKLPQTVRADPPKSLPVPQMVWKPDEVRILPSPIPAPNLVAIQAPKPKATPKSFTPPAAARPAQPAPALAVEPPSVVTTATLDETKALQLRRWYVPGPATKSSSPGSAREGVTLDAPPADGGGSDVSLAVIGLQPGPNLPAVQGTLPGRFSAGPNPGPPSGHPGKGSVAIPNLSVEGANSTAPHGAGPSTLGPAPFRDPPLESWQSSARATLAAALRPGSRVVPPAVEARFTGRTLYAASFRVPLAKGSTDGVEWVIWFAERTAGPESLMRPPVPLTRLTGDTSIPVKGRATILGSIDPSGRISDIRLVHAATTAAGQTAAQLAAGWQFLPASKGRSPIAVDVLIEFYQ